MTTANPKFPNATIVEALCEIHLERDDAREAFDLSRPLPFYQAVEPTFPFMEATVDRSVTVGLSPEGKPRYDQTDKQRLRFLDPKRESLVQIGNDAKVLSYNVLKPYPGWERMRVTLEDLWPKVAPVLKPAAITQVGLRYINRIEKADEPVTKLSDWLKPNQYLPSAVVNSLPPYSFVASSNDEDRELVVRVHSSPGADAALIFDIDVIWKKSITPRWNELSAVLDRLHADEWEVFHSSITDRYERHLSQVRLEQASLINPS